MTNRLLGVVVVCGLVGFLGGCGDDAPPMDMIDAEPPQTADGAPDALPVIDAGMIDAAGPACGNDVVEAGEECDPPDGVTCDDECQEISAIELCANGVDDGDADTDADCADADCTATCADACVAPTPLSVPSTIMADLTLRMHVVAGLCQSVFSSGMGPDAAYLIVPTENTVLRASLISDSDLGLFLRTDCADVATEFDCIDAVPGGSVEELTFAVTMGMPVILIVGGFQTDSAGTFELTLTALAPEVDCTNANDDDSDGFIDCADPSSCQSTAACLAGSGVVGASCTIHTDCAAGDGDPHCLSEGVTGYPGGACSEWCALTAPSCPGDGICVDIGTGIGLCTDLCASNDDCLRAGYECMNPGIGGMVCYPRCTADSQCTLTGRCHFASGFCRFAEICDNGMDDDGDFLADCLDEDCGVHPECNETGSCNDGLDNDGDLRVDCADDLDCASDPACPLGPACAAAVAIPTLPALVSGTTAGAGSLFGGTCTGYSDDAPEVLYSLTLPGAPGTVGTLHVEATAEHDLGVYVRTACLNSSSQVVCTDLVPGFVSETFDLVATAGDSYTIFIDGFASGEAGPFELSVSFIVAVCGDGAMAGFEQCDDGNTIPGDGCSGTCTREFSESEPNNTPTDADAFLAPWTAEISPALDRDFVAVTVPGPASTLMATVDDTGAGDCPMRLIDSELAIYGTDGVTVLVSNDDIDPALNWCSSATATGLAAGTYYVRVAASSVFAAMTTFDYVLEVVVTP